MDSLNSCNLELIPFNMLMINTDSQERFGLLLGFCLLDNGIPIFYCEICPATFDTVFKFNSQRVQMLTLSNSSVPVDTVGPTVIRELSITILELNRHKIV